MFNTKIFENGSSNSSNQPVNSSSAMNIPNNNSNSGSDHLSVPQPIDITYQRQPSVFNSKLRRESIAHSQGMGGVSWGSVTIGSWLKDEVMMFSQQPQQQQQTPQQILSHHNNTNNLNNNNNASNGYLVNPRRSSFRYGPSIMAHSPPTASYLPDLEADYCKDYSCCGQLLPTLHDLLRHYEEAHISQSPPIDNPLLQHQQNRNRQNMNNTMHNIMETVSTNDVFLNNGQQQMQIQQQQQQAQQQQHQQQQLAEQQAQQHAQQQAQQQQAQQQQAQQLAQQQVQQQAQQSHQQSSQSSHISHNNGNSHFNPSLPDFTSQGILQHNLQQSQQSQQSHQQSQHLQQSQQAQHLQQGSGNGVTTPDLPDDEDSMYIDDPARHLYVMEHQEHKPFRCPVIGCDKNYKNQNGLKYHRLHGHQNQTLKENPDGTISIIDPESNAPYLDGAGMEKDKPYRCEVCGKRYKNLNGLKYHRGHTTH